MRPNIKKTFRYFLLILFLSYFLSISLFNHTHIVDGVAISHSHPFNPFSGEKQNHQHSQNELVLIHFISHFLVASAIVFSVFKLADIGFDIVNSIRKKQTVVLPVFIGQNGLRAPPAYFHN